MVPLRPPVEANLLILLLDVEVFDFVLAGIGDLHCKFDQLNSPYRHRIPWTKIHFPKK
jgi:hypothetical protein